MRRSALLACTAILIGSTGASAQVPEVRGYYLNVASWTDSTAVGVGGLGNVHRFRLMTEPTFADLTVQIDYQHVLHISQRDGSTPSGLFVGLAPSGGEWLPLQGRIATRDHLRWDHRLDRANVRWAPSTMIEMAVGRQTASWATTLFLTPADPFLPFDPSDPFREYRAGVDALRFQYFPGPFSDVDVIVRPADFTTGQTWSALARGRTVWHSWEVSGWLGMLYDEPAAAVGAAGSIGSVAVRGELTLQDGDEGMALRGTVGIDGRFSVWDRDLFYVVEYQRDGFGAGNSSALVRVVQSGPYARGQLQVLGRDELVAQGSFQVHPLWNLQFLVLANLDDPSALFSPAVSRSLSNEVTANGGVFIGFGDDAATLASPLPSEYGLVPSFVYLSLTVFM